MWGGLEKNITYEFVLASPAVSRISCSFYLDGFWYRESKWPYSCFVGCCFQDLFKIARSILV